MNAGWRHRTVAVVGVAVATVVAVGVANHPAVQSLANVVPVYDNLDPTTLRGRELVLAAATTLVVVLVGFLPLYEPRPRRPIDTVATALHRVAWSAIALATLGYFDYTYRLPRTTLVSAAAVLAVATPALFLRVSRRPSDRDRAVVVGDDPDTIAAAVDDVDLPVVGYACPRTGTGTGTDTGSGAGEGAGVTDGGVLEADGGLSVPAASVGLTRLDDFIVDRDVDTAVLAFTGSNRGEFFGALRSCHEHGITVRVREDHAESVLTNGESGEGLVGVDIQPWNWWSRLAKRAFDVAFSLAALVALTPVMAAVAVAIKAEDGGPVLYGQERTAEFGDTFPVYKFRSMVPDAESETGATISEEDAGDVDPRVTRVGRVLRRTHLDEIPQLWSILVGHMSVVGPRPERPELDADIESGVRDWPQRWFVKPGLTGLAQINDVTGVEPERKLRYDVEYIRRQSFGLDVRVLAVQLWMVARDTVAFVRGRE